MFHFELTVRFARALSVDAHFTINATLNMFATRSALGSVVMLKIRTCARPTPVAIVHDSVRHRGRVLEIRHFVHAPRVSHVDKRTAGGNLERAAGCGSASLPGSIVCIKTSVRHLLLVPDLNSFPVYKCQAVSYPCPKKWRIHS